MGQKEVKGQDPNLMSVLPKLYSATNAGTSHLVDKSVYAPEKSVMYTGDIGINQDSLF